MVWSRVSAQEEVPIDIVIPDVIIDTPAPELEQPVDIPLEQGGIVVNEPIISEDIVRDEKRLDIMAFQSLSYESTGEFTQVKDVKVVQGDVIGFDASMVDIVEPTDEIHVYEAPCGKGWQLIVHDFDYGYITSSTTGKTVYEPYPVVRSYGYGCEHDSRTENW